MQVNEYKVKSCLLRNNNVNSNLPIECSLYLPNLFELLQHFLQHIQIIRGVIHHQYF